jgi:hypothetical protein
MSELPERLFCTEIAEGHVIAADLFRRKFNSDPPTDPHHLFVMYRGDNGFVPVAYSHFAPFGDICLVGGSCTDGLAFGHMSPEERDAIRRLDGLYYSLLRYGFERYREDFTAFFGYCGDPRALEVDLRAGFETTEHDKLIKYFPREVHPNVERALVAKAHALGPF